MANICPAEFERVFPEKWPNLVYCLSCPKTHRFFFIVSYIPKTTLNFCKVLKFPDFSHAENEVYIHRQNFYVDVAEKSWQELRQQC